ncbi:Deleted in malignant brain tumors 1 protein [Holothuria leucospilota]|uniref:Deleted in malignant brain tumors 1 protein n=1 Tax=Holothuria leucospilota TaxID=206669 RepID=A0A9Q0YMF3_HOLLE|nr:Deleted in malignant brain tumors 1 protein [Holothuria leucospilota]
MKEGLRSGHNCNRDDYDMVPTPLTISAVTADNVMSTYKLSFKLHTNSKLFVYTGDGFQGIRLGGGIYTPSGRVELLINEIWGTARADGFWDLVDARVVCRQLGYQTAISITENALFGKGFGPVWMGDVQCTGDEKSISRCKHSSPKYYNPQYVDAGIICGGNTFYLF